MKRILVTGATGFVGKAIVGELLKGGGYEVYTTGRRESAELPNYIRLDLEKANIRNDLFLKLPEEIDIVVHAAGLAHQFGTKKEAPDFQNVNFELSMELAEEAADQKVKKFILISSISVYGENKGKPASEDDSCDPDGEYAVSKFMAEEEVERSCKKNGVDLAILRLATVYGPEDVGNVLRLIKLIDSGKFFWTGKGDNLKSLVFSEDAGRAVKIAIESGEEKHGTYNVTDAPHTMREIVETIAGELGRKVPKFSVSPRLIETGLKTASYLPIVGARAKSFDRSLKKWLSNDVVSGEKIARELNFKPSVSLAEGIGREVAWYKGYRGQKNK